MSKPEVGALRISWMPEIGRSNPEGKTFVIAVHSPADALRVFDAIAEYDLFLLDNDFRPDSSATAAGFEEWDGEEWISVDREELEERV